jgi:uncharacterized protein (DUF433 family)
MAARTNARHNSSMLPAISINPEIQGGTPCFAGTRVPVKSLFDYLAHDRSLDYFLQQFPSVKREQAMEVLEQARQLVSSQPHETQPA